VRVPDLEESRRLEHVANGEGIGISVLHPGMEPHAPGVVFRRFEEPTPLVGYGVAWSGTQPSPFVDSFLEIARAFVDPEAASVPS
jgi:hypothetical protein